MRENLNQRACCAHNPAVAKIHDLSLLFKIVSRASPCHQHREHEVQRLVDHGRVTQWSFLPSVTSLCACQSSLSKFSSATPPAPLRLPKQCGRQSVGHPAATLEDATTGISFSAQPHCPCLHHSNLHLSKALRELLQGFFQCTKCWRTDHQQICPKSCTYYVASGVVRVVIILHRWMI